MVTAYTTSFFINERDILSTENIYMFRVIPRLHSDFLPRKVKKVNLSMC
jgi:hypothetical protein